MADDSSIDDFENFLKKKWKYERRPPADGKILFVVTDYEVVQGQNTGKKIQVAFPIPQDYPTTAPYGVHVKTNHGLSGNITNVSTSALGPDWQFWSRTLSGWSAGRRNGRFYVDHVNRWLEL